MMKYPGGKLGFLLLRTGWKILRFFLRYLIPIMLGLLSLFALYSVFTIWRVDFSPMVLVYIGFTTDLLLIIVIILTRDKILGLTSKLIYRGGIALEKIVAKKVVGGMVKEGLSRGEAALKKGAERAEGLLSSLTKEVEAELKKHGG